MELQRLQEQLAALEIERDGKILQGNDASVVESTIREVKAHIADIQNRQQAHEGRIQEATAESSSFLGDIDIAGVPIAESGLSELAFNILNAKVQAKHIAAIGKLSLAMNEQQMQHQQELKTVTDRAIKAETDSNHYQTQNKDLEVANYQLGLEKDELDEKTRKGAELLYEATETIKNQDELIEKYKKAELLAPPLTVVLSTSEQVAQQEAQLKASRIKVTSMVVDTEDFAKRTWYVTDALTGETKAINYLEKGNYTVVTELEAEQLRADEANKKAELELQNTIIPVMTPDINPVFETVEATPQIPFHENQTAETADYQGNTGLERNQSLDEGLGQDESEVITLETLKAEVEAIKTYLGIAA